MKPSDIRISKQNGNIPQHELREGLEKDAQRLERTSPIATALSKALKDDSSQNSRVLSFKLGFQESVSR